MTSDFWTPDGLFHHYGKSYGLDNFCRTVLVLPEGADPPVQPEPPVKKVVAEVPVSNVTDNSNRCEICHAVIQGKRIDRKFCSPRCRKVASRKSKQPVMI